MEIENGVMASRKCRLWLVLACFNNRMITYTRTPLLLPQPRLLQSSAKLIMRLFPSSVRYQSFLQRQVQVGSLAMLNVSSVQSKLRLIFERHLPLEAEGTKESTNDACNCLTSTLTFLRIFDRWAEFKISMPLVNPINICIPYIKWLGA